MEKREIARVQGLAKQVREIAELPIQEKNRKLWTAVNDLRMIRPVIHVRDYPHYLIRYGDELETTVRRRVPQEDRARPARAALRNGTICAATASWSRRSSAKSSTRTAASASKPPAATGWTSSRVGSTTGPSHFETQITCEADLEKIKTPVVEHHEEETMRRYGLMREIFGDILEVRLFGRHNFRCAPMDDIFTWMGIAEGLEKLATEPELMHRPWRST